MTDNFKGIVYLTKEQYETLYTQGSIIVEGKTIVYDENALYITSEEVGKVYRHSIMITGENSEIVWTTVYTGSSDQINTINGLNTWMSENGYTTKYLTCTGTGTNKIITGIKHSLSDGYCNCMEVSIGSGTISSQASSFVVSSVTDDVFVA